MNESNATTAEEKLLRETLEQQAPRPSAAHNEAIMDAARKRAAKKRRQRMIERNRSWSGIGVAAALLLAAGVWVSLPNVPVIDDTVRGEDPAAMTAPADNATLDSAPSGFQWADVPGTLRYRVQVHDATATVVWQSDWTESSELTVSVDDGLQLSSSNRYFWVVELDGDSARRSLGPYWFSLE